MIGRDVGLPTVFWNDYIIPGGTVPDDLVSIMQTLYPEGEMDFLLAALFSKQYGLDPQNLFEQPIVVTFTSLRNYDRFYYEAAEARNTNDDLTRIKQIRISDIIRNVSQTVDVTQFDVQKQGFFTPARSGIDDSKLATGDDLLSKPAAGFDGNIKVHPDMMLSWSLIDGHIKRIRIKLTVRGLGWWAIGFEPFANRTNFMQGLDIGVCINQAQVVANDYYSLQIGAPTVDINARFPDDPTFRLKNDLTLLNGGQQNGISYCEFIRPIPNSDPEPYDRPIPLDREALVAWAFNSADNSFNYHGPTRGTQRVDFQTRKYYIVYLLNLNSKDPRRSQIEKVIDITNRIINNGNRIMPEAFIGSQVENSNAESGQSVRVILNNAGDAQNKNLFGTGNKVVAFVGENVTDVTITTQIVLKGFKQPQVTALTRSDTLFANQKDLNYLFRAVPPYSAQAHVMAKLIKQLNRTTICAIFSNDEYSNITAILTIFRNSGVNVTSTITVSENSEVDRQLKQLQDTRVRYYVLFTSKQFINRVLTTADSLGMMNSNYFWICADSLLDLMRSNLLASSLQQGNKMRGFVALSLTYTSLESDYFKQFAAQWVNQSGESINSFATPPALSSLFPESLYVHDTIYAISKAVQKLRDQNLKPQLEGQALTDALKEVSFMGATGWFQFSPKLERTSHLFDIFNYNNGAFVYKSRVNISRVLDDEGDDTIMTSFENPNSNFVTPPSTFPPIPTEAPTASPTDPPLFTSTTKTSAATTTPTTTTTTSTTTAEETTTLTDDATATTTTTTIENTNSTEAPTEPPIDGTKFNITTANFLNLVFADGTTNIPLDVEPIVPPIIDYVTWSDPVAIAAVTINSVCLLLLFIAFLLLIYYRGHKVIRASSPVFLHTALVGVAFAYGCVYAFTATPSKFVCNLRPWLCCLAFSLIFGSLLVKTYRIVRILGTLDWAKIGRLSTNTLLGYMALIAMVYIIVLIVWSAYDPLFSRDDGDHQDSNKRSKICDSNHKNSFEIVLFVYSCILLLSAAIVAFKSRRVKSEYGEAQWIALTLYNIVVSAVVVVPVNFAIKDPQVTYPILVFGIIWAASVTAGLFYIPKFYLIWHGTGSTSHSTPSGSGGHSYSGSGSGSGTLGTNSGGGHNPNNL